MEKGLIYSEPFKLAKIKNGSIITIGEDEYKITITTAKHFNRFQKYMIKWCFGFCVEDYSDNEV